MLKQAETGAQAVQEGLMDTGSDSNFLDEFEAKLKGFVPLAVCDQEFVTFDNHRFRVSNAYDLKVAITDDRGETRVFCERFYSCKDTRYYIILRIK